jgi:perosamine synthetase
MIPRFAPTYNFSELIIPLISRSSDNNMKHFLKKIYGLTDFALLSSGRACIYLILSTLLPGEVILPSFICYTVPEAILMAGHKPKFLDIEENTLSISMDEIEKVISEKTRAFIFCHPFGIPGNISKVRDILKGRGITLIEDAAAAFGATYSGQSVGTLGDVGVISFNNGKPISLGSGGLLLINNKSLYEKVMLILRELKTASFVISFLRALSYKVTRIPSIYYWAYKFQRFRKNGDFWENGKNAQPNKGKYLFLMDGFTQKLLENQDKKLDTVILKRRKIAERYRSHISNSNLRHLTIIKDSVPAWACYPFLVGPRREFFQYMHKRGIDLSWSWNYNCADLFGQNDCKNTSSVVGKIISLPTSPHLTDRQVDYIISCANSFKI